jgi:transposase
MLKKMPPQDSFYGSYLYDRIVPVDHLLRKINQVVDFSFVNELVKDRYTPDFGRPAEDPEFMLRLCLLQYIYGDSDREVVANARINLAYKYFLGLAVDEEVPDDTTISVFRTKRLGEEKFRQVFEQVVKQCIDKGLVKGKRQIIDSTHIQADAARSSLTGLIRMCRRNMLQDIAQQDKKIAETLGINEVDIKKQDRFTKVEEGLEEEVKQARDLLDTITEEMKQKQLKPTPELVRSLELLEKAAVADRNDDSKDRLVSPVDPDARMGKKEAKRWVGYKGHLVVEEDSEIITAVETTPTNVNDGHLLKPLLNQEKAAHDLVPEEISGDKAYDSGVNLELLETRGITGNISLTTKINVIGKGLFTADDFHFDAETNNLTCPAGNVAPYSGRAVFTHEKQKKRGRVFQFSPEQCNVCYLRPKCHPSPRTHRGRTVYISYHEPLIKRMRDRLNTEAGKEAYRNRYRIEHKVADLARYCGMRRCRYRGLIKARIHTLISATVSNVKRMARLLWHPPEILPGIPAVAG